MTDMAPPNRPESHDAAKRRPLQFNPEPIRIVERRSFEPERPRWRCEHEDGRGRCTSRETTTTWNESARRAESYCAKHEADRGS